MGNTLIVSVILDPSCQGSCQGIVVALIQRPYFPGLKSLLANFQKRTRKELQRKLLDCKSNSVCGARKALISKRLPRGFLPGAPGEQLRFRSVVEQLRLRC